MKIKRDKYQKTRSGISKIYRIFCAECVSLLGEYQKDGVGQLRRLYQDRYEPVKPQHKARTGYCVCGNWYGVPYIYRKEDRPAIKLFVGKIRKKL